MEKINKDDRYHYPSATVFENAPLAMIQLTMEHEMGVLSWVSGLPELKPRRKK